MFKPSLRSIKVLLESLNYEIPRSPQVTMYDFYVLSYLSTLSFDVSTDVMGRTQGSFFGREHIKEDVDEAIGKLLPSLKKELLDATFLAIAAEMRHLRSRAQTVEQLKVTGKEEQKVLRDYVRRLATFESNISDLADRKDGRKKHYGGRQSAYDKSAHAADKVSPDRSSFVGVAEKCFRNGNWNSSYGGKAWADICEGWLKLNSATRRDQQIVYIDHLYDLEHNTGTVFNKVARYADQTGGFDWIKQALDAKASFAHLSQMYGKCSSYAKKLAQAAMKAAGKSTQQIPDLTGQEVVQELSGGEPWLQGESKLTELSEDHSSLSLFAVLGATNKAEIYTLLGKAVYVEELGSSLTVWTVKEAFQSQVALLEKSGYKVKSDFKLASFRLVNDKTEEVVKDADSGVELINALSVAAKEIPYFFEGEIFTVWESKVKLLEAKHLTPIGYSLHPINASKQSKERPETQGSSTNPNDLTLVTVGLPLYQLENVLGNDVVLQNLLAQDTTCVWTTKQQVESQVKVLESLASNPKVSTRELSFWHITGSFDGKIVHENSTITGLDSVLKSLKYHFPLYFKDNFIALVKGSENSVSKALMDVGYHLEPYGSKQSAGPRKNGTPFSAVFAFDTPTHYKEVINPLGSGSLKTEKTLDGVLWNFQNGFIKITHIYRETFDFIQEDVNRSEYEGIRLSNACYVETNLKEQIFESLTGNRKWDDTIESKNHPDGIYLFLEEGIQDF